MKKEFKADYLKVEIYGDRKTMGEAAAAAVVERIRHLLEKQSFVNIIFAAAPSQNEFLAALVNATIDWQRVRAFHMDEYIGLSDAAPQRFGNFLKERIFSKLPFAAVHYLEGNAENIDQACSSYSRLLSEYPADIVCMGIGENGHIAFNDPPVANFNDEKQVKLVELEQACRQQQVNDGCFAAVELVPETALTLTIPALMAAKYIYCIVPGPGKAAAVYNTLQQAVVEQYPSTILRTHGAAILYLDAASSSRL